MGGRIDDVAVDERRPSTIYIGAAFGGLWKHEQGDHVGACVRS
jgi:hypothetical protein